MDSLGISSELNFFDRWALWACFATGPIGDLICEPSRELQESLGPSGPEIPKKSEKSLPGPEAPGPQKVWKKSRKSPEQTFSRLFPDFSDFFKTLSRLFGAGRLFSDSFGISGPEGPRDSCSSREGSQDLMLLSVWWCGGCLRALACLQLPLLVEKKKSFDLHQGPSDIRSRVSGSRGSLGALVSINSVQTRCIVKGEAQKSPLFWRFSGGF